MASPVNLTPLPNVGMAGASTLSLAQEKKLGIQQKLWLFSQLEFITDPLLSHYLSQLGQRLAKSTQFPSDFNFYLINSPSLNAFATFGGHIYFYTGLVELTSTESQLASVLAHEISHVTQRHLAMHVEKLKTKTPLTLISTAGSILVSLINPMAGMALLSSTLAGNAQYNISFTQQHEREADTIGLTLLMNNGFEPQGMTEFMERLSEQNRLSDMPPEVLLTHPLPTTRIAYVKNRITHLTPIQHQSSLDYYLAKVRLAILLPDHFTHPTSSKLARYLIDYQTENPAQNIAAQYGKALLAFQQQKFSVAQQITLSLLTNHPNNIWFLELATEIDLALQQVNNAIQRLTQATVKEPEQAILQLNLIKAYTVAANYTAATNLLHRYTHRYPDDWNGWALAIALYGKTGQLDERYLALARQVALKGDFTRAITLLNTAKQHTSINSTLQRIQAQIERFHHLQENLIP